MCGGGGCAGDLIYVVEKVVTYLALTAVIICIIITICIALGVGAGIGYNYCFVNKGVEAGMKSQGRRSNVPLLKSREFEMIPEDFREEEIDKKDKNLRRANVGEKANVDTPVTKSRPMYTINPDDTKYTLIIRLNHNLDFSALIEKLRVRNKNATLELIT